MQSQEFSETLNLNLNQIIKLQGGYDCDYVTNSGTFTTISGSLTISSGTVTVENIKIK